MPPHGFLRLLLFFLACALPKTTTSLSTTTTSHDNDTFYQANSISIGILSTVAGFMYEGNGLPGGSSRDNCLALHKRLFQVRGIAIDKEGNLFIASAGESKIYKVTASSGRITAVSGALERGFSGDGGQATLAQINNPNGVTLDTSGNIFIADTHNSRIRKVTVSTGVITTVAGNGAGFVINDNVAARSASLNMPRDVAVDASDNIFIADTGNGRIRKVTASTGMITTIAGTGNPIDAFPRKDTAVATEYYLHQPSGVTLDTFGNIFIAGDFDPCIFKVTVSTGNISIVAGTGPSSGPLGCFTSGYNGDDILATTAKLSGPTQVALDSLGNMFIADERNSRIRKLTASTGLITTVAGTGVCARGSTSESDGNGGSATLADLWTPSGVAVDTFDNFYFSDNYPDVVKKVTYIKVAPGTSVIATKM